MFTFRKNRRLKRSLTEEHCDKMVEYYSELVDQYNPEYAEGSHDAQVDDLDGQFQNFTVY